MTTPITYKLDTLTPEMQERFSELMNAGDVAEAMALLPREPLTPEQEAALEVQRRKEAKSAQRFNTFVNIFSVGVLVLVVVDICRKYFV